MIYAVGIICFFLGTTVGTILASLLWAANGSNPKLNDVITFKRRSH